MNNLNTYIEQTLLRPDCLESDISKLIIDAKKYEFAGVCVPPYWVKSAKRDLGYRATQIVTVVGFPFGYNITLTKVKETELAILNGADEIDLVMNLSAFKTDPEGWAKVEVARIANLAHENAKILKVIIETAYLTPDEIYQAAKICADAGADFIKTSTGFASRGATVQDIEIIKSAIPASVGIKASGGIKTKEQAIALINAGATRIGTSSGIEILNSL